MKSHSIASLLIVAAVGFLVSAAIFAGPTPDARKNPGPPPILPMGGRTYLIPPDGGGVDVTFQVTGGTNIGAKAKVASVALNEDYVVFNFSDGKSGFAVPRQRLEYLGWGDAQNLQR